MPGVKLIDGGMLDIDTLLNSLIVNNIANINKTLQFNGKSSNMSTGKPKSPHFIGD